MGILSWIIFGLIVILAEVDYAGKDGGGFFVTVILGIVGSRWRLDQYPVRVWQSRWLQFWQLCRRGDCALVVLFIYRKIKS